MYEFIEATAADVMTAPCKYVSPQLTVGELQDRFELDGLECYPVVSGGTVVGIASKFDALRPFAFNTTSVLPDYDDCMRTPVGQIMFCDVACARPDTRLTHILQTMVQHRIESLPVLDAAGGLLGVVGREDIFQALRACAPRAGTSALGSDVTTCRLTG